MLRTMPAMLAAFEGSAVARAVRTSYRDHRTGAVQPTTRAETRHRGEVDPSRWEVLENSLIELDLPDDGFVWLVRSDSDQAVDFLDRMAPALPDVSIEVMVLDGLECASALDSIETEKRAVSAQNLPPGWTAGPQLVVGDDLELIVCHEAAKVE